MKRAYATGEIEIGYSIRPERLRKGGQAGRLGKRDVADELRLVHDVPDERGMKYSGRFVLDATGV